MLAQLVAREREQRPHQSAARFRPDAGETGGRAAAQRAQQDGFDLIILVMGSDDVFRAAALLNLTQPRVARVPRVGLRRVTPQILLDSFEREAVALDVLS